MSRRSSAAVSTIVAPPAATTTQRASAPASWAALFGCPAPQRLASLVEQAVAWREQVLLHGDVSTGVAHDLRLSAEHALQQRGRTAPGNGSSMEADTAQLSAVAARIVTSPADAPTPPVPNSRSGQPARAIPLPPATSQLLPGSQLVKAHGGRNHVVRVEENGFCYEDATFASLSAVARHITGTHWNGLLFFGLRKRRSYPPKPRSIASTHG